MRICYFGAFDDEYPRNLVLRRGLEAAGAQVIVCRAHPKKSRRERVAILTSKFEQAAPQCDALLLAEFNAGLMGLAHRMARYHGKKLIFDAFAPLYDAAVTDRMEVHPLSLRALGYRVLDWLSIYRPDFLFTDTEQHRQYFIRACGPRARQMLVLPVGASVEWFRTPHVTRTEPGPLVLFYGSYIPLHGVDVILRAVAAIDPALNLRFELIGAGQTYAQMRALAAELGVAERVNFRQPVSPDVLRPAAARADLLLGVFGASPKTARVIPNKVYQALAMGKPVITADTPALREQFTPGEHLEVVPPGDPDALAASIEALVFDAPRRAALAEAGHAHVSAHFTEEKLGARLLQALQASL